MGALLKFAPRPKPLPIAEPIAIDQVARERAEGIISDFCQKIGEAEALLSWLGGFIEDGALVGAVGIHLGETREQIPALREAIRSMPDMDGAA